MIRTILLTILSLSSLTLGQRCPPAEELLPCTCNEEFVFELRCEVRTTFDIQDYFQRIVSSIDEDTVFEQLTILNTQLTEIPSKTTQSLKFKYIYINYNANLEYVAPDAFPGSQNITDDLFIQGTKINNTVFGLINSFPNLKRLTMADNKLESIPDFAFGPLEKLSSIYIGASIIDHIGSKPFSKLSVMEDFTCWNCGIFPETWNSESFEGVSSQFALDLQYNNNWSFLNETLWEPVLDNVAKLSIGGEYGCGFVGCKIREFNCDERADWICQKGPEYIQKISGFYCLGGNEKVQISDYCLGKS